MNRKITRNLLVLAFLGCGLSGAGNATSILMDGQFVPADWSTIDLSANNSSSHAESTVATGGNPDAFRRMTHTMPGGFGSDTFLWVFHQFLGGSYDPSSNGAIASLDYAEDQIVFDPPFSGAAVGTYPALIQGGIVFVGPGTAFTNTTWQTRSLNGLTADDFVDFDSYTWHGGDGVFDNPDFLSSGSEIHFGYIRANSTPNGPGTPDTAMKHGIDNWSTTVHSVTTGTVPEPATLLLLGIGLASISGFRSRGRQGVDQSGY